MNNSPTNQHTLFPYSVKLIGIILLSMTGFIILLVQTGFGNQVLVQSDTLRVALRSALLISLFLIASSRDKTEDELVALLRLKAFEWSFRWGILYTMFDLVLPDSNLALSGFSLIFSMLIVYLLVFYFKKRERDEE